MIVNKETLTALAAAYAKSYADAPMWTAPRAFAFPLGGLTRPGRCGTMAVLADGLASCWCEACRVPGPRPARR